MVIHRDHNRNHTTNTPEWFRGTHDLEFQFGGGSCALDQAGSDPWCTVTRVTRGHGVKRTAPREHMTEGEWKKSSRVPRTLRTPIKGVTIGSCRVIHDTRGETHAIPGRI